MGNSSGDEPERTVIFDSHHVAGRVRGISKWLRLFGLPLANGRIRRNNSGKYYGKNSIDISLGKFVSRRGAMMVFLKVKALGLGIGLFVVVYVPALIATVIVRPRIELAILLVIAITL
jgi:hypothetical protein